jgi:hypothetical protein
MTSAKSGLSVIVATSFGRGMRVSPFRTDDGGTLGDGQRQRWHAAQSPLRRSSAAHAGRDFM